MTTNTIDRKYMELAVDEMLKSRGEHTNKIDPLVGVVLADKNGSELERTHRGSLRVGEHAEYALIERMLGKRDLEGATIYVTLEPCTRRTSPKKPCAERIVSARIARVFIGIPDPNPNILGKGIRYLMNHGVEVDFFDLDLVRQINEANQEFIAYHESAERTTEFAAEPFEGPSMKELEVLERASLADFSEEALNRYVDCRKLAVKVPSEELWEKMERAGYIGRATTGKAAPTVAGIVLFASNPTEILPQCRVSIEAKKSGRTIPGNFEGPLMEFRDHIEAFFMDQMRDFEEIREMERSIVKEYPLEAIREAAFNAMVHRDYQAGVRVHITIKEGEVEIKSPGGLLQPLTLYRVRSFNAPPFSRNPHIALAVHRMGWIEEKGSGLARMRDAMIDRCLRPPLFNLEDGYFVVRLLGEEKAWHNVRVAPDFLTKLEKVQQGIVQLLMDHHRISTKECIKQLDISERTVQRHLAKLEELQIVERRGRGSKVHFVLKGE